MTTSPYLVWVDIETTGLDPDQDYLLEVGVILTTPDLEVIDGRSVLVCDDPAGITKQLNANPAVHEMHSRSGLLKVYPGVLPASAAEAELGRFLRAVTATTDEMVMELGPMCGSSVHFDRAFLKRHMPRLEAAFHYRNLDISGIREAAKLWAPHLVESAPTEKKLHRALPDIDDTLALARHFRTELFRAAVTP